MKDYWNELNLSQRWSKKERFNYIMAYIDGIINSDDDEEEVVVQKGAAHIVAECGYNPVNGAVVVLSRDTYRFEAVTDDDGCCDILEVPYGEYAVSCVSDEYGEYTGSTTIDSEDCDVSIVYKKS